MHLQCVIDMGRGVPSSILQLRYCLPVVTRVFSSNVSEFGGHQAERIGVWWNLLRSVEPAFDTYMKMSRFSKQVGGGSCAQFLTHLLSFPDSTEFV